MPKVHFEVLKQMSESYHTFFSKTIPANPPTYLRTKIHHYWLIPCLNPSRPCMMMPMINCERRGTRLWNYGESSRERIFFLAKTAITCINGVKFEAPQQLKFFRLYIWDLFSRKMCAIHHGHYGGMSLHRRKWINQNYCKKGQISCENVIHRICPFSI